MRPDTSFKIVVGSGVFFAAITTWISQTALIAPNVLLGAVLAAKVFLTSFNVIVLTGLTVNYGKIYQEIPTSTSRSLLIFSAALLLYAVSANPVIQLLFGSQLISVGPFTYLPDLFVALASVTILYESYQ